MRQQLQRLIFVLLLGSTALVGCASKQVPIEKSPVLESAERIERRAAAAYNKGDLAAAVKDYQVALHVYESLAMVDAQAGVQLSLARIDAQDGRVDKALERSLWVLDPSRAVTGVTSATRLLASGRAAALYLQQNNLPAAKKALDGADALCASTCEALPALLTLRADWQLANGEALAAEQSAALAITKSTQKADMANAQRTRAKIRLALKNHAAAAMDAQAALALDQETGQSPRVIADLGLLVDAYEGQGNAALAAQYRAQLILAKQAVLAIGKK